MPVIYSGIIIVMNLKSSHAHQTVYICITFYTNADTELTPWSQWACFNSTVASRNRTVQNCSDVEYIDPVTNMTTTNRSCDNRTETDRRTGSSMIISLHP